METCGPPSMEAGGGWKSGKTKASPSHFSLLPHPRAELGSHLNRRQEGETGTVGPTTRLRVSVGLGTVNLRDYIWGRMETPGMYMRENIYMSLCIFVCVHMHCESLYVHEWECICACVYAL